MSAWASTCANALTGWEPPKEPKTLLLFPEMAEERDLSNATAPLNTLRRRRGRASTGMRERYLEVFDSIRIDCLNGDKY